MKLGRVYIVDINDPEQDYFKSYIGQTIQSLQDRLKQHFYDALSGSDTHFHRAIRKYGTENVSIRALEDGIEQQRLPDREELWIGFYDTYHNGLNSTSGGDVSPMSNPENVAKLQAIMREKYDKGEVWMQTPEGRKYQSEWQTERAIKGEHHTQDPETRSKSSATKQAQIAAGTYISQQPEWQAKNSAAITELARQGKHPMQDPETVTNMLQTRKVNKAEKNLDQQREANQGFFFKVEEYEKTSF